MIVLWLVWTYLVASIPFGLVVTTLWGGDEDIRTTGSGNIGATNVARVHGWRLAGVVIALDVAKGFLPVLGARLLWPDAGHVLLGAVLMTAFLAHCFPVWLEFRGGKGVATGAGGLLALAPWVTMPAVAVWLAVLGVSGRSSVAALTATLSIVVFSWWVDPAVLGVVLMLALGILLTHVPNLRRLVRGEEAALIRPVRWGRQAPVLDADRVLEEGPAGQAPPVWREKIPDPLEPTIPPED
ncbi:MAG: glycerol-3-phosphate 1-O-acyltransferase PlsY [Myxococcales bacterium]|nr:glycerol-3-phosphate 1-O-acyltransferase PlsY [Myxococcales bacterium]